jgi:hypothetical protein
MSKARVVPQRASLIVVLLGSMLAACSGPERAETSTWSAVFDTIGDTVIVRSEGSVWGDTAQLVQDLRIGVLEGADEYMFGDIQSLAVATDGAIYTYDSHLKVLRKHSATGDYIATLGREGEGPGEYNRPDAGLVALADGRVLLRDPGNARISGYSADGEYLDGLRIRGGWMSSRPLFHDTAGNVYQWVTLNPEADFSEWSTGLVRYGPDGIAGDTLEVPDYDFEPPQVEARSGGERRSFASTPVPFSPDITWAFSPLGYFVAGLSEHYAIDLFVTPDQVLRIEHGHDARDTARLALERTADPGHETSLRGVLRWHGRAHLGPAVPRGLQERGRGRGGGKDPARICTAGCMGGARRFRCVRARRHLPGNGAGARRITNIPDAGRARRHDLGGDRR